MFSDHESGDRADSEKFSCFCTVSIVTPSKRKRCVQMSQMLFHSSASIRSEVKRGALIPSYDVHFIPSKLDICVGAATPIFANHTVLVRSTAISSLQNVSGVLVRCSTNVVPFHSKRPWYEANQTDFPPSETTPRINILAPLSFSGIIARSHAPVTEGHCLPPSMFPPWRYFPTTSVQIVPSPSIAMFP